MPTCPEGKIGFSSISYICGHTDGPHVIIVVHHSYVVIFEKSKIFLSVCFISFVLLITLMEEFIFEF